MPLTKVDAGLVDNSDGEITVAAGAISASQLATSAVETAKINDSAVTTAKLNDDAVTLAKIADAALSGSDTTLITGTAGTANNVAMWNADGDLVEQATDATKLVGGKETTTEITVVSGANVYSAVSHSLGAKPHHVDGYLICKTAELGFTVGDEVGFADEVKVVGSTTQLTVVQSATPTVLRKDTAASATITPANWKIVVKVSV